MSYEEVAKVHLVHKLPAPMGQSTVMVMLLFGTNAILFCVFYLIKVLSTPSQPTSSNPAVSTNKKHAVKELSKPFNGTLDCCLNLTAELFRTGLILFFTYACEYLWYYDHSTKFYSRDIFFFIVLIFFAVALYTIQPVTDLSLLGREQTEEWKGWMQFIFLLYHYFHAEEVYNSVRVMITCYVWMTGFGNFSFFYIKQDFGWLRVVQMLWRLNFSVLLLMWTHGNTYILYYICPLHTFYFLVVFATMYIASSYNTTKYGIRWKLLCLGVVIYLIWDVKPELFDFLFSWLGTNKIVGASNGSIWEYYFRTSLDHYSTFFGMIFALNYPLAEQYFKKASTTSLVVGGVLMALATIWWVRNIFSLDKLPYNLVHSYYAIIPLTSYIFFRNITPFVRSGVSMSLHELGKTTLETYLLQHHIWLTSNAKTLLTIVNGSPLINFSITTIIFYFVARELYRLTMTIRGMILPDDKAIAWRNMLGSIAVVSMFAAVAYVQVMFVITASGVLLASELLALCILSVYYLHTSRVLKHELLSTYLSKAMFVLTVAVLVTFVVWYVSTDSSSAAGHRLLEEAGRVLDAAAVVSTPAPYKPKPTGSMSDPYHGAAVLLLSVVMLFLMDSYLGFGYISLFVTGEKYNWEEAYSALHSKIHRSLSPSTEGSNVLDGAKDSLPLLAKDAEGDEEEQHSIEMVSANKYRDDPDDKNAL